jgi:hypothetical protein
MLHEEETYSRLKGGDFLISQGIRLGNDGNEVDLGVQFTHNLHIQRLQ